jgi:hypothetical protein
MVTPKNGEQGGLRPPCSPFFEIFPFNYVTPNIINRMAERKLYKLTGVDGKIYLSETKGAFGGHRGTRGYGRMDCRAALRAIARGGYKQNRVFFADEATAIAAGYRPCAVCLTEGYALWKRACTLAGIPPTVQSRNRRQPALDIYRDLLRLEVKASE